MKYYSGVKKNIRITFIFLLVVLYLLLPSMAYVNRLVLIKNEVTTLSIVIGGAFLLSLYLLMIVRIFYYKVDYEKKVLIVNVPKGKQEVLLKDIKSIEMTNYGNGPTLGFGNNKIKITFNNNEICFITPQKKQIDSLYNEMIQAKSSKKKEKFNEN